MHIPTDRMDVLMSFGNWFRTEMEYTRDLADSGWNGAVSAWENLSQEEPVTEVLSRSARNSVAPTLMCAGLGALCALLIQRGRRNRPIAVALGLAGGFLGFSAAVAWETRGLSSGVARGAWREMTTTRDTHWLDRHPINFG